MLRNFPKTLVELRKAILTNCRKMLFFGFRDVGESIPDPQHCCTCLFPQKATRNLRNHPFINCIVRKDWLLKFVKENFSEIFINSQKKKCSSQFLISTNFVSFQFNFVPSCVHSVHFLQPSL